MVVACRLAFPWPLRGVLQLAFSPDTNTVPGFVPSSGSPELWLGGAFIAIVLCQGLAELVQRLSFARFSIGLVHDARAAAIDILSDPRASAGADRDPGDLITRVIGDSARVKSGLKGVLIRMTQNGIFFFGPKPLKASGPISIDGPPTLDMKATVNLHALEGGKQVGDSDVMVKTAANRFFSKPDADQTNTLTDLLSSSGRRAINLLTHDQLFSAKTAPARPLLPAGPASVGTALVTAPGSSLAASAATEDEDDPLAIIIRKACSRELTDLGLIFNSLNIKVVQSEVAEARRRQSAAEAQANADIVSANQSRRAKEAQLDADRAISDKQRELEQTRASNAALIAQAEAKRQEAAGLQRTAELDATQVAQVKASAAIVRLEAEASADAEAIRIRRVAEATAES